MSTAPLQNRIRLAQLRLLVAIAETGSLQRAAQVLHITQPAATKSLRLMEASVGDPLVLRGGSGSALTPMGEILCKRARLVMAELRDAEEEMSLWHTGGAGHVTIGTLPVATPSLVPEALTLMRAVAPRITATVVEGSSDAMYRDLRSGALDLVVGRFYPGQDSDFSTKPLYESTFRLGVRAAHPLAARRKLTWDDVLAYPWILPPAEVRTRPALDDMFRRARVGVPEVPVETTSYLVMRSVMFNSDAICPMPVEVFRDDVAQRLARLLAFRLDLKLPPISVVWLAKRAPSPAAITFVDQLEVISRQGSR
jgi:DNA-binding transcriptional LysR family regulator